MLDTRSGSAAAGTGPLSHRIGRAVATALVASYPYLHAGLQGTRFFYHLHYLLGAPSGEDIPHSPVLHALRLQMARVSAEDMVGERGATMEEQALSISLTFPFLRI